MIIGRIERIGTIKQSFELTTHLIIIDGRSEYDYIGILHFGHDCGGIIVDNAVLCFLTGETSFAETDVFFSDCYFFDLIPCFGSSSGKRIG